jgi:uncharacterized membrane protein
VEASLVKEQPIQKEIGENDRLIAALCYPVGIVALAVLLFEGLRTRPFQKYHAVHGMVVNVALGVVITILAFATISIGTCLISLAFVPLFYWAYQAYQGEWLTIPGVTDLCYRQSWL